MATTGTEIAVIGGSGFIGRSLVRLLEGQGENVRIIDIRTPEFQSGARYINADISNYDVLLEALRGCGRIVNLAAAHRDDVRPISLYYSTNVNGAANTCKAAAILGIDTIVFTSSVAIYGFYDGIATEDTGINPFNHYGKSKWEAEKIFKAWQAEAAGRTLEVIRPTVVFGPGNRGNVYNLLRQLASGKFVMVGNGKNRKSMSFVENVAAFLSMLTTRPSAGQVGIYNYADQPDFDMNEMLGVVRSSFGRNPAPSLRLPYGVGLLIGSVFDIAARLTGRTFPVSKVRVEKFCANTMVAANRVPVTGFTPPYDLRQALMKTVRHEFPQAAGG